MPARGSDRPLLIAGAGGFSLEVVWLVEQINSAMALRQLPPWRILGYLEDAEGRVGTTYHGLSIIGDTRSPPPETRGAWFHVAIGHNASRLRVSRSLAAAGLQPASLIHPRALIAPTARVGVGCHVAADAVVNAAAEVGDHVILNISTCVGHEAKVGEAAQLCPGARVLGQSVVERLGFLGSNATLHAGRTLGRQATIGANSFAAEDVAEYTTVIGIPAVAMFRVPPEQRVP